MANSPSPSPFPPTTQRNTSQKSAIYIYLQPFSRAKDTAIKYIILTLNNVIQSSRIVPLNILEQYILWRRNCSEISRTLYLMHTESHSISLASSKKSRKRQKNTLGISSNTHIFQKKKNLPLTIFSSRGGRT